MNLFDAVRKQTKYSKYADASKFWRYAGVIPVLDFSIRPDPTKLAVSYKLKGERLFLPLMKREYRNATKVNGSYAMFTVRYQNVKFEHNNLKYAIINAYKFGEKMKKLNNSFNKPLPKRVETDE